MHEHPRAAIERYCREEAHRLVLVIDGSSLDGGAGSSDAQFQQLVGLFAAPDAKPALVVVPDSAHLARSLEELVQRLLLLASFGAEVRCADEEFHDPIQSGLNYLAMAGRSPERDKRIRESILAKAARGEVLGRTPFGYSAGLDGQLKPVPEEAQVVQDIFAWYTGLAEDTQNGRARKGLGLRNIAYLLNERGLKTRQGNLWTPMSVAGILKNRVYIGVYTRMGMRLVSNHEPLIDRATYNHAQELMLRRRTPRSPGQVAPFTLGRVARCKACGRGLHGVTRKRSWTTADGEARTRVYRYYECPVHRRDGGDADRGRHASWRAEALESAVADAVRSDAVSRHDLPLGLGDDESAAEAEANARREFMRTIRNVAAGTATLSELAGPLDALKDSRDGAAQNGGKSSRFSTYGEAVAALDTKDSNLRDRALRALVQRVDVGQTAVAVTLREPEPASPTA